MWAFGVPDNYETLAASFPDCSNNRTYTLTSVIKEKIKLIGCISFNLFIFTLVWIGTKFDLNNFLPLGSVIIFPREAKKIDIYYIIFL